MNDFAHEDFKYAILPISIESFLYCFYNTINKLIQKFETHSCIYISLRLAKVAELGYAECFRIKTHID